MRPQPTRLAPRTHAVATAPLPQETKSTSQCGLDWFAFFLADIQTGWGPFLAAYLTSKNWTQLDIGLILTGGTLATMALQIPIGALVDRVPSKRLLAAVAVAAISGRALLLALQGRRPQPSVAKYKLHRKPGNGAALDLSRCFRGTRRWEPPHFQPGP